MRELVHDILAVAPKLDEFTAECIAKQLHKRERPVSAREEADYLGLHRADWVYANAERLGGRRLGDGKRPRWRFYLSEVRERLQEFRGSSAPSPIAKRKPKPATSRRGEPPDGLTTAGNELLDFEAA